MKTKVIRKSVLSTVLCTSMLATLFTGCSSNSSKSSVAASTEKGDVLTVDVFDNNANYQGIQSGWYGKLIKDKFNIELNIISPNVSGGGDSLYATRSAAGNLGDLIIVPGGGNKAQDLVNAGLVMDISPYMKNEKNLDKYKDAIAAGNKNCVNKSGTFLIPSECTTQSGTTPCESGGEMNTGVYSRWDLYKQMGYPKLNTMEDMLGVLKKMQDANPTSDSGKKVYAFSFFKDWDGGVMEAARQGCSDYGYGMENFCFFRPDGSDYQSAIASDSTYVRTLKMFFNANQQGLVDPESTTQNYDTLYAKYQDGAVLYAPWPWLGKAAYNTTDHKNQGKAMEFIPFADEKIYSYGCYPEGNANELCVMVGSKAKDPQRLVDYIDWMYSPEGIEASTLGCGPEGMTWNIVDGKPALTDFGKSAILGDPKQAKVDSKWGSGSYYDGQNWLNFKAVAPTEVNPKTNFQYDNSSWESVQALNNTEIEKDWKKTIGFNTTKDYLIANKQLLVSPGISVISPQDSSNITAIRNQCKSAIVEKSWQMVFAKSEAEFNSLLKEMQDSVNGLGYDQVYQVDLKNAKDKQVERDKMLNKK